MTKCDFCTKSDPEGKCLWNTQSFREDDCEKAINRMVRAFGYKDGGKKEITGRRNR